ncbi:MAG: hypothetical protein ACK2UY_01850, partial [Anaerolineae bacterium]
CERLTLTVRVTVPVDVAWNISDTVTLTARSLADPAHSAEASFVSKAPAPILVVDDGRWYDSAGHYTTALQSRGLPYDVWQTNYPTWPVPGSPSRQQLARYPVVIWFTGRDWHSPLDLLDEFRLTVYLQDGGRLLLSSQEYLYHRGYSPFGPNYLGVIDHVENLSVTQVVGGLGSPLVMGAEPIDLYYPFRNWSDALRFSEAASPALWGQHGQPVALTLDQPPWKTAFFAFPLETMPQEDLNHLIGEAVGWLSPLGDSWLAVDRAAAQAGEPLTYTIEIRNTGPQPLAAASLSNTIPAPASYVASSLEGPANYDPAARRVHWEGPLAAGEAVTISYRVQLDAALPAGSEVSNVASLRDESGLSLKKVALSRIDAPDLSASAKAVSVQESTVGRVLTYTITLRNGGPASAPAELIDPWPPYTLPVPGSPWASGGQITATEHALQWRGIIPAGEDLTLRFGVVPLTTSVGLYAYNRATVDDGRGRTYPLEAYTWIEARLYLPLIFR